MTFSEEITSADHGSDSTANAGDRFYEFDAIGNRDYTRTGTYTDSGGTHEQYSANDLNQYTGTTQNFGYDDDGNLETGTLHYGALAGTTGTSYSATLEWNAENRLIEVKDGGTTKVSYTYDYLGRRISRTAGGTTTWYVYDGWNLIAEYAGGTFDKSYTWGMDLSGTLQGTGGVGGLLCVTHEAVAGDPDYFPVYDGNGNVTEYLNSDGTAEAHFEYDPFGRLIANTDSSGDFPIRFSTKMLEDQTGLYYYGYRYLDPVTGRWPSRDPIGEKGGLNAYTFVRNYPVARYDFLGLVVPITTVPPDYFDEGSNAANIRWYDCPRAVQSAPATVKMTAQLREKRCRVSLRCRCSEGITGGRTRKSGFNNWVHVTFWHPPGTSPPEYEVAHELQHALDYCEGWLKNDCRSHICSEIKAYAVEAKISLPGLDADDLKPFIINGAVNSAKDKCKDEAEARRIAEEIYGECSEGFVGQ